jgi:dihydrofolate synthase/folylpolyglutamate synthase
LRLGARGPFQRRNFALARAAAEAQLRLAGRELDEQSVLEAAVATVVPGRLQVVSTEPLTVLDGAHNPDAVAALAESMEELFGSTPPALLLGVLEDKDAASMLRLLLPLCARTWFAAPPSGRALSPAALESRARQLGFTDTVCEPRPERALAAAQAWAAEQGVGVLATGSVYLVGELLARLGLHGQQAGAERDLPTARRAGGQRG